jgi:hypothetical protein
MVFICKLQIKYATMKLKLITYEICRTHTCENDLVQGIMEYEAYIKRTKAHLQIIT